jgi:hypothetical protein
MIYDLESVSSERKEKGLLRAEVRLTEPKAIRCYTDEPIASGQMAELITDRKKVFLDTFLRVVPFGNFYKKEQAVQIIRREVKDRTIRFRMLHLIELVPEKKSLLLAQKALSYRRVDKVMDMFRAIDLSPVTISKRHEVKELPSLYRYLGE